MLSGNLVELEELGKKEYIGQKPGTSRIKKLLKEIGNPQNSFQSIHIAGTNGKGSTAMMIYSILYTAGYSVGLYTSPHLVDFCERMRVNNTLISKEEVARILAKIWNKAVNMTYFEILTAVAFIYFQAKKVDIAVIEVGLGGKYDATNVLKNVLVTILTPIDYDHKELLGDTLSSIAQEKIGIFKRQVPVVSAIQRPTVEKIINRAAKKLNCRVYSMQKDFLLGDFYTDYKKLEQKFSYFDHEGMEVRDKGTSISSYENLSIPLLGIHQLVNASLALKSINLLRQNGFDIPEKAIYRGLKEVNWQCRFEFRKIKNSEMKIVIDGAHNLSGIKMLISTLKDLGLGLPTDGICLVMSVMREKEYEKMIRELAKITAKVILYKCSNLRSVEPTLLYKVWKKYLLEKNIYIANTLDEIMKKVDENRLVCVTGSLYLAGEFKKFLDSKFQ
ncbi:MAG: folylpolyglutamate synthase/dihydrofolate synthase family protein [Elusimicrobiota bacterium]|nr:folylpolyglutamate synthase/dihydrofolate synthase family protein [Elusimicrobiota bacterium]